MDLKNSDNAKIFKYVNKNIENVSNFGENSCDKFLEEDQKDEIRSNKKNNTITRFKLFKIKY